MAWKIPKILISFQISCKEAVSSTISGWIKKVLKLAKVDTGIYKAHKTCTASTSNVKLKGLSLIKISKKEDHVQENLHVSSFVTKILFVPPQKKIQNTLLRPLSVTLKKDGKFLEIQSWMKYLERDKKT